MRVKKRRSDLDHSVFVLRKRECDQEVNQSECKAETGPADKQVEDAQFPAVLQKTVCTTREATRRITGMPPTTTGIEVAALIRPY